VRSPDGYHGTVTGYTYGCRDECCRGAMAKYQAERRALLKTRKTPPKVHGTLNGYVSYGCRCDACMAVKREYARNYLKDKTNSSSKSTKSAQHRSSVRGE